MSAPLRTVSCLRVLEVRVTNLVHFHEYLSFSTLKSSFLPQLALNSKNSTGEQTMSERELTPSQITITQSIRNQRVSGQDSDKEESDDELTRLTRIAQIEHTLKNNAQLRSVSKGSRNKEMREHQIALNALREREWNSNASSDSDFQSKPRRTRMKPRFTYPPHSSQGNEEVAFGDIETIAITTNPKRIRLKKLECESHTLSTPNKACSEELFRFTKKTKTKLVLPPEKMKHKEISRHDITLKHNRLVDKCNVLKRKNKSLEMKVTELRREVYYYRSMVKTVNYHTRLPTNADIANTPLSDEELNEHGHVVARQQL